ncbi:MAG: Dabb family protein [Clostridiales bacterium]|nr:Dabb family protein [Clostridiales bacterium]
MMNHHVYWNFIEALTEEEKKEAGEKIKSNLTSLKGAISGLMDLEVIINTNPASNRDVALISKFESQEALDAYQIHPKHLEAASYVRSVTCDRICFDY